MDAEIDMNACPKCDTPATTHPSCSRCGLLRERWPIYERPKESSALIDAWNACEADWSNEARHDALLALGLQLDELPALARRYRQRSDAIAQTNLNRIIRLVETGTRAEIGRTTARASTFVVRGLTYVFAVALFGGAAFLVWRTMTMMHR